MTSGTPFTISGDDQLWFILSDPEINSKKVLAVPTSRLSEVAEVDCYCEEVDHSLIGGPCWIDFSNVVRTSLSNLRALEYSGQLKWGEISPTLIQRLWSAAGRSRRLKKKWVAFLRQQGKLP